jgi:hypothetical protein
VGITCWRGLLRRANSEMEKCEGDNNHERELEIIKIKSCVARAYLLVR